MRVEPLGQHLVPMVAQGEPDEGEHVKVKNNDEYLLPERGRPFLLGRRLGALRFLLRYIHTPEILRVELGAASVFLDTNFTDSHESFLSARFV